MDAPRLAGVERTPDRLGSMFSAVSWRYDFLNALMSLGQDAAWRRALARPIERGERELDLCCGSARTSVPAFERSGARVTGVDVSFSMLERGRDHAREQTAGFDPVHGDGFALPFRDATFDVVIVAFGLRNLVPLDPAAREIRRVLRPGGRLLALHSVAPARGAFAPFHALYLRAVVPLLGRLSPDPSAYRYLVESIFDFGTPDEVSARLAASGFASVRARPLLLGAVALFEGRRSIALSPREGSNGGGMQTAKSIARRTRLDGVFEGLRAAAHGARAASRKIFSRQPGGRWA
jgi:demethylmenaquinone methyltransferase/2-methoxy-6-polyprenyl-1,4-benzoquinol methylase